MKTWALRLAIFATLPGSLGAETLTFEVFAVSPSGERERLAGGVQSYDPATDIVVQEAENEGSVHWGKWLLLEGDFAVGASVYRQSRLTGFGLVVARRGDRDGFSWEWFDLESDGVFVKLQGPGRIAVTLVESADYEELQSIAFLDERIGKTSTVRSPTSPAGGAFESARRRDSPPGEGPGELSVERR